MVSDGSLNIAYNELNLPKQVSGASSILYTYDAAGTKLKKQSASLGTTDYVSGIQYQNGAIDFIQTEEGQARNNGNNVYLYEYFLKDHLGNTRVVYDAGDNVLQKTDYYPFGMEINRQLNSPKINLKPSELG